MKHETRDGQQDKGEGKDPKGTRGGSKRLHPRPQGAKGNKLRKGRRGSEDGILFEGKRTEGERKYRGNTPGQAPLASGHGVLTQCGQPLYPFPWLRGNQDPLPPGRY